MANTVEQMQVYNSKKHTLVPLLLAYHDWVDIQDSPCQ